MHCIVHGIAELDMTERLSLSFTLIFGFMYSPLNLFSAHFSMVSATSCSFTTPPPFSFPSLPNSLHNLESNRLFLMSLIFFGRRQWHPTPVLLPGKSQGQRSLVGCSPWGCQESDTTERLHFHFSLSCIGEGNGNPLQCSCLENPRDGGAWWAAIYGVAQSRTQLK